MMNTKRREYHIKIRGRGRRLVPLGLLALVSLGMGCADNSNTSTASDQIACKPTKDARKIAAAKLFIEHNATDKDTGVHGGFDDDGWSELCVYDPNGTQVLAVKPQGQLKALTVGGIFFESREPPNSDVSIDELTAKFPEGRYQVRAISFDGSGLTGSATFTHDIPKAPTIISPALAEDEQEAAEAPPVSISKLVVAWKGVSETLKGDPITITGYEVIVTKEVEDDPHGFSRPTYDVHVPADRNTLAVPVEFLEPDTVYEIELLALEKSGNQTISAGFFKTK